MTKTKIISALVLVAMFAFGTGIAEAKTQLSFLNRLAATPSLSASIVPGNGDQNPYGVAVVPRGFRAEGTIQAGDILVSNFNNSDNAQGMGTTIVDVNPNGHVSTFFATSSTPAEPVGLTTALITLNDGIVIVGNTPTSAASPTTPLSGSLIFLNSQGKVLLDLKDATLQGPWDMTADTSNPQKPILYVSNVLNGTVTRINMHITTMHRQPMPVIDSLTVIASGFGHHSDPAALVVGPTGLLLSPNHKNLYVADTANNRIQLIHNVNTASGDMGSGVTVTQNGSLHGPLALAWSPIGTILAVNGDAPSVNPPGTSDQNLVVEIDPATGATIATRQIDTGAAGAGFGITVAGTSLIYVDDDANTVNALEQNRR